MGDNEIRRNHRKNLWRAITPSKSWRKRVRVWEKKRDGITLRKSRQRKLGRKPKIAVYRILWRKMRRKKWSWEI